MNNVSLIGIAGRIGSGKDTVGNIIQLHSEQHFEIRKFAHKLKHMVCLLTGCTMENLEDHDFKNLELPREWWSYMKREEDKKPSHPNWNIIPAYATDDVVRELGEERIYKPTYREFLQKLGTEGLRNVMHENVHVNALFADYNKPCISSLSDSAIQELKNNFDFPSWIITDVRFPNEADAILNRGGILLRVERPSQMDGGISSHAYETALDGYQRFSSTILNHGTIEDLHNNVKNVMNLYKIN